MIFRTGGRLKRLGLLLTALGLLATIPVIGALAYEPDATDRARNLALPCEEVSTPGLIARTNKDIFHVANVCGFVGTDMELQSRKDLSGKVHDYAFVGTMGAGFRIYDVTEPTLPDRAGGYLDSGWQNDIQVAGDIAVASFDGVSGEDSSLSTCLKSKAGSNGQGVDIYRLNFNELTAKFETNLLTCVANPPGGAHNTTLHPGADWLAISNPSSDWAVDVIDLRATASGGEAVHRYRYIDESRAGMAGRCPTGVTYTCVVMTRPDGSSASGLWRPHDVSFSRDGRTMYVAAIQSTWVVDVRNVLSGSVKTLSIIPNVTQEGGSANSHNIAISHQADVTPDGKILVIGDEQGGGTSNTECLQNPDGLMGGLHFWALGRIDGVPASRGASPTSPKRLGAYFNPNPNRAPDPLGVTIADLPRAERGCTVHVFRIGGNGTSGPGESAAGFGGVSTLPARQLATAWYGGGVWRVDFSGPPSSSDGIAEDSRTTWGNTLGWNVMPGADTWSAKEYKGHVYAGDMLRGFDVYRLAD
jgi:DNA-binding beta-propeller fold protein YncE